MNPPNSSDEIARAPSGDAGQSAASIRDISLEGWKQIFLRVRDEVKKDRLSMVAAGVSFYSFLSIFPAFVALLLVWSLWTDPESARRLLDVFRGALPSPVLNLLEDGLVELVGKAGTGSGFGAVFSFVVAVWSANKGTKGLIEGIEIAYDEEARSRGFLAQNALALSITGIALVGAALALGAIVALPAVLEFDVSSIGRLLAILRWPALAVLVLVALAVLYRFAPPRDNPRWQWVTPGSVLAATLWLAGSAAFSFYISNFGSYDKTYGSLGAVAVLLVWLNLSAFVILLGAEVNAETEKQTAQDTTVGPAQPMGARGAVAADTYAGNEPTPSERGHQVSS